MHFESRNIYNFFKNPLLQPKNPVCVLCSPPSLEPDGQQTHAEEVYFYKPALGEVLATSPFSSRPYGNYFSVSAQDQLITTVSIRN